jgi:trimethylamine--corrinoid protein Co-methyltransferase
MASGFASPGLQFRILSDDDIGHIHFSALEVLRRTGVRVHCDEALALLRGAGCEVTSDTLVRFPADVIEAAVSKVPSRVTLCDRDGRPRLLLEGKRSYFGTGSDLPYVIDPRTGERRGALLRDVADVARLVDALERIDFLMSMALPADVPPATADRHAFRAMVANTVKPIVFTAWHGEALLDILDMATEVAGGAEHLRLNPFLTVYLEPSDPLQFSRDAVDKLLIMADRGLPAIWAPGPIVGANAPISRAGCLVQVLAEIMAGVAIAQLRHPGAPLICGGGFGHLDMRSLITAYSGPEFPLLVAATCELMQHYGIPTWGYAGYSDSQSTDVQAGIEATVSVLLAALSGGNLNHDVGYLEAGRTASYELIAICDEIVAQVKKLLQGVAVSDETACVDVIDAVGPGGNALTTDHTLAHFREVWYPNLAERRKYEDWVATGSHTMSERARAKVLNVLDNHRAAPLPDDVVTRLDAIVARADQRGR